MARASGTICIFAFRKDDEPVIKFKKGVDPAGEEKKLRDRMEQHSISGDLLNSSIIYLPPYTVHLWATRSLDWEILKKTIVKAYDNGLAPFDADPAKGE